MTNEPWRKKGGRKQRRKWMKSSESKHRLDTDRDIRATQSLWTIKSDISWMYLWVTLFFYYFCTPGFLTGCCLELKSTKTSLETSRGAELSQKWDMGMLLVATVGSSCAPRSWSNLPSHQRLRIISPNEGLSSGHCTFQINETKWPSSVTPESTDLWMNSWLAGWEVWRLVGRRCSTSSVMTSGFFFVFFLSKVQSCIDVALLPKRFQLMASFSSSTQFATPWWSCRQSVLILGH